MNELLRRSSVPARPGLDASRANRSPALLRHPHDHPRVDGGRRLLAVYLHGALPPPRRRPADAAHRAPAGWMEACSWSCRSPSSCSGSASASTSSCAMQTPPADAMDVYVTGKQWMWKFAYPDGPNGHRRAARARRAGRCACCMTSRDVIHWLLRARVPHQAGRAARPLHADWFDGDRARHATRSSAPSTAAPATRRCAAEVEVMDAAGVRRLARASSSAGARRQQDRSPDATRRAPRHSRHGRPKASASPPSRAASSATPSTARRTSARPGSISTTATSSSPTAPRSIADEAYLTESMMDPAAEEVAGFQPVMPAYQGKLDRRRRPRRSSSTSSRCARAHRQAPTPDRRRDPSMRLPTSRVSARLAGAAAARRGAELPNRRHHRDVVALTRATTSASA